MSFDGKELGREIVSIVKAHIDNTVTPLKERVLVLEAEIAGLRSRAAERGEKGDKGDPGASVSMADVAPVIEAAVAKAVAAIPVPKAEKGEKGDKGEPGLGVANLVIDRSGHIICTMSDGTTRDLGPGGKDGKDGFALEDFSAALKADGRTIVLKFQDRSGGEKVFELAVPAVIDRGIWREGSYKQGDGVTTDGSFWIAQRDTEARPGASEDWRLSAKRGRDGKSVTLADLKPVIDKAVDLAVRGLKAGGDRS